jgi:signal transduction histidine kinase
VSDPLDYVLTLAEAGLAEMRALIFELRPESLKTEGLVAALVKQADSLRARHRLEVRSQLDGEPLLSLEAKEALYRIAQEALHNIAKHARARVVDITLQSLPGGVRLEICDDGVGFDPLGDFPGHLGLKSMRERAERMGGQLHVDSAVGAGTRLRAEIPFRA